MGQYTVVHGRSNAIPNAYVYTRTVVELHLLVRIKYLMSHGYYLLGTIFFFRMTSNPI